MSCAGTVLMIEEKDAKVNKDFMKYRDITQCWSVQLSRARGYCSQSCQIADWPKHKSTCKKYDLNHC